MNRLLNHLRSIGLGRRQLLPMICFFFVAGFSVWLAYEGEGKPWFAIGNLAMVVVFLAILNALNSALTGVTISHGRELLEAWFRETQFGQELVLAHVDALAELADYDPAAAEGYREKLGVMLMAHHPGLADELARIREKADWN